MIDQRLAVISLARLKKLRKSRMRRGQRFRRKHLPKQNRARAQPVLLHQHAPVHRLGLALAARAALLVVVREDDAMRHQFPPAAHPHPLMAVHGSRLPRRPRPFMRRRQLKPSVSIGICIPSAFPHGRSCAAFAYHRTREDSAADSCADGCLSDPTRKEIRNKILHSEPSFEIASRQHAAECHDTAQDVKEKIRGDWIRRRSQCSGLSERKRNPGSGRGSCKRRASPPSETALELHRRDPKKRSSEAPRDAHSHSIDNGRSPETDLGLPVTSGRMPGATAG